MYFEDIDKRTYYNVHVQMHTTYRSLQEEVINKQ